MRVNVRTLVRSLKFGMNPFVKEGIMFFYVYAFLVTLKCLDLNVNYGWDDLFVILLLWFYLNIVTFLMEQ